MLRRVLLFAIVGALHAQSIIIRHATVIDATGAAPKRDFDVLIERGHVMQVAHNIKIARGAQVIDGKGKFLIPGLWDMHIHLPSQGTAPDIFFPLLIANGITGVRDMFTAIPAETVRRWRASPDLPRIVVPGFLDGPPMLSAGMPPPGAYAIANPDQARFAVRALAQSGVDFIKVYNSIPRDAYFALAEEARAIGIPFAGHVPEAVSPLEASNAGQRSQEHLINLLLACSTDETQLRAQRIELMLSQQISGEARMRELAWPNPAGLFDTYSESKAAALFATFVKNGTWQTPTLALLDGFARAQDSDFVNDPRRKYLPAPWTQQWDPHVAFFLKDLFATQGAYEQLNARIRALLARYEKLVGDMRSAGVEFLAGTDANGTNPVFPAFGLHRELQLLVESGLTPMEALQAATRNPARYLKAIDVGTIEPGRAADLVLLNADPLRDIHNTEKIEAVFLRGKYFSRADLDAMLERVARVATPASGVP